MRVRRVLLAALVLVFVSRAAAAQSTVRRFEAGGDVSFGDVTFSPRATGASARLDVNITSVFALESRATWFSIPYGLGSVVHVAGGVRATLLHGRRLSLYGVALPG